MKDPFPPTRFLKGRLVVVSYMMQDHLQRFFFFPRTPCPRSTLPRPIPCSPHTPHTFSSFPLILDLPRCAFPRLSVLGREAPVLCRSEESYINEDACAVSLLRSTLNIPREARQKAGPAREMLALVSFASSASPLDHTFVSQSHRRAEKVCEWVPFWLNRSLGPECES